MTEYTHLMTPAERQRLASQVRPLLQQPELSEHHDYLSVKTTLRYHPAKDNGPKRRRKHVAQQSPSLEFQENELGLTCELVMAKGRSKVRIRSCGHRFAALVVSSGLDDSRHFSVAVVDADSKNLEVVLGDEAQIAIVGIHPDAFLNSLSEAVETGAEARKSNANTHVSDVPGRRRPRTRAVMSVWNIRDFLTLKGSVLRILALLALYMGYRRLEYGWRRVDDMTHYRSGRLPPSFWNSSGQQYIVDMAELLQRFHEFRLDDATHQALVSRRQFDDAILTAIFVDIPKLCISVYVGMTLVVRGGAGPFYRTLCCEAVYLAFDEYWLFTSTQIVSVAYIMTSFESFGEDMLREALRVFYICLLWWNPADRTHTLRYLVRSLAASVLLSIFLTALVWTPFFMQSAETRTADLNEYTKRYHLPELRPSDMRDIPFVTA